MPELQPSWQLSLVTAVLLAVLALAGRRAPDGRLRVAGAFGQEFALVMSLLALWQLVGGYVHTREAGAIERGRSIWAIEHALHMAGEGDMNRAAPPPARLP